MKKPVPPPFAHQKTSTERLLKTPRALDTSDPGTGKTRVQIDTFSIRRGRGGGCALVLAPKSLISSAWAEDFAKFAPHLTVSVAPAEKREKAFAVTADVYVTNIDAVRWLVKQPRSFFAKFDTLIIDEISAYKHHSSQRSKALNKIKKYFKNRYGLTGTPNSNGICDIWHQVFIVDDGQRLGPSFFQFRAAVCTPKQIGPQPNMLKWEDKPDAEITVSTLISDIVVRHKFEECIDIPENHQYTVPYTMTAKQARAYQDMERHAIAQLSNGTIISAVNGAVVAQKLMQIASGASYADAMSPGNPLAAAVLDATGYTTVDDDRYELIAELVLARKNSVVFFNWKHQRDKLIEAFNASGITHVVIDGSVSSNARQQAVKDYQAGFYKVLLAHPQSAAHGLTLTRGTSTIWASPTHNLEHFLQGNRRIYRAGQTEKTETVVVIAKDTIEEEVYNKCMGKSAKQESMLDLLKSYFRSSLPTPSEQPASRSSSTSTSPKSASPRQTRQKRS